MNNIEYMKKEGLTSVPCLLQMSTFIRPLGLILGNNYPVTDPCNAAHSQAFS